MSRQRGEAEAVASHSYRQRVFYSKNKNTLAFLERQVVSRGDNQKLYVGLSKVAGVVSNNNYNGAFRLAALCVFNKICSDSQSEKLAAGDGKFDIVKHASEVFDADFVKFYNMAVKGSTSDDTIPLTNFGLLGLVLSLSGKGYNSLVAERGDNVGNVKGVINSTGLNFVSSRYVVDSRLVKAHDRNVLLEGPVSPPQSVVPCEEVGSIQHAVNVQSRRDIAASSSVVPGHTPRRSESPGAEFFDSLPSHEVGR